MEWGKENDGGEEAEESKQMTALDAVLPNEMLESIFSFLPIVSLISAGAVCRRWREAVHSRGRFLSGKLIQQPWYFMFTRTATDGYAYDPSHRKWYPFGFPCIQDYRWLVSSSSGLICFMDHDTRSRIFVCNPVNRNWKKLPDLIHDGMNCGEYAALAFFSDHNSFTYTAAVVKSRQVPGEDFLQGELSVQIYDSDRGSWVASVWEDLTGWRGGNESVICSGVLYILLFSLSDTECRHGLIAYDLSSRCSNASLAQSLVLEPCYLTCCRLMNLKDRLVIVGGIGKHERPGIIKGVGIWELNGREWIEIARMPHRFFQGFRELDDLFMSCGNGDLVYIQSFGSPVLLTFDTSRRHWQWSAKCPVPKRFYIHFFSGFCFEPRLEATP